MLIVPFLLQLAPLPTILMAVAAVILLGYIADALFKYARIPDVLLLMLIGILIVQVFHVFPDNYVSILRGLIPILGSIALVIIIYDGTKGISLASGKLKSKKGLILSILDAILPPLVLAPLMYYLFGWPLIYGAILGAISASTGMVVVISILNRLNIPHDTYETMLVEATFNSVTSILVFTVLLSISANQLTSFTVTVNYLVDYVSVSLFIGAIAGIAWLFLMSVLRVAGDYLVTIAVAILLYGTASFFNGAGIVAVFVFSIIIANYQLIGKYFKLKIQINEKEARAVERNFTFLIKTFFFVFLGMVVVISMQYLIYGILIAAILIALRYPEIKAVIGPKDRYANLSFAMFPRDTTTAVLAGLVYAIGGIFFNDIFYISFIVIVVTNILTGLLVAKMRVPVKLGQ